MTNYWVVALTDTAEHPYIQAAAELIREGKRVAFPTETVYGLGADATNTNAVESIYQAKGRPTDNPLIVHISRIAQLNNLVAEVDEISLALIDAFWPGPLTLVLPVQPGAVSPRVTAGLSTVAVRKPQAVRLQHRAPIVLDARVRRGLSMYVMI
jgi:L-threonylcarbamoyladenylate synthase